MNNLIDINTLLKDDIDNNYIESLLNSLKKHELITVTDYENIIMKLIQLLSFQIKRYTGDMTSSVPISVAKNLNASNLWIIGFYLKDKSIDESIDNLINKDINYLFECSKKKLNLIINKTKMFYNTIFLNNIIEIDNYFYNATLKDGIKGFFKLYNYSYDAHTITISVDYETCIGRPNLYGIEFINKYLEFINYENIFCNKFNNIDKMLQKIYNKYQDMPINIFENVLIMSVVLEYFNKNNFDLDVLIDVEKLYAEFSENEDLYVQNLNYSYNKLITKMNISGKMKEYIDKCFEKILKKIVLATKCSNLELLLGYQENKYIDYYVNNNLDNHKFNDLIKNCGINSIANKEINSIYDVIEIFNELNEKELELILSKLQTIELMILKKYYSDTLENEYVEKQLNRVIMLKNPREQEIIYNNYKYINIIDES